MPRLARGSLREVLLSSSRILTVVSMALTGVLLGGSAAEARWPASQPPRPALVPVVTGGTFACHSGWQYLQTAWKPGDGHGGPVQAVSGVIRLHADGLLLGKWYTPSQVPVPGGLLVDGPYGRWHLVADTMVGALVGPDAGPFGGGRCSPFVDAMVENLGRPA